MDITIHSSFLPHNDPDASLAFYRDTLGFEVRNDVGYNGMRWITVGPAGQPGTSIVLYPPSATPGITDDERRTIAEMMAKGTYATIILATADLDGTFERLQASGAEVIQEPTDQPYGVRDCAFRDPAGNLLRIQRAALNDEQATSKATTNDAPSPALRDGGQPRSDPRAGRAREQPQGRQRRDPEAPADGVHRRLRLGQELAGVRHDRRGVAAADQRDLQRLRAGLHADAGAARRRRARRADDGDHRRPGADGRQRPLHRRHRHRRQRDAAHPLQPARQAAHRLAQRVLVQRPLGEGQRCDHRRARRRQDEDREGDLQPSRRHVSALRGHGLGHRLRPVRAVRRQQVAQRGRAHDPRLQHGRLVRPHLPRLRLLRPGQADPQVQQEGAARPALQGADQDQGRRDQPDLRGADPADPEVVPVQGRRRAAAAHPRLRGAGGDVQRPAPSATAPGSARRPGRRRSRGRTSPTSARCRSATWPTGSGASTSRRWRRCSPGCSTSSTRSRRSGWATSRSTGRRARCRAARRSAPR